MIKIRKSEDRGIYDHGWLHTSHTFSFAQYYNPEFSGFSDLLVINEDFIESNHGFGKHYHDNMEIISYVISGNLEHEDSMGNKFIIKKRDMQVMSAGNGVMHSEKNPSESEKGHFFQIWIVPNKQQLTPSYSQKNYSNVKDNITLIASETGEQNSLIIHQNAKVYLIKLKSGESVDMSIKSDRSFWIQLAKGEINVNDNDVKLGDGIYGQHEKNIKILAKSDSELLFFDLN